MKGKRKIIIADNDSAFTRELLQELSHYSCDTMALPQDGRVLLRELENIVPDIVLMEYSLGTMDAVRVIEALRKLYPGRPTLYIPVTDVLSLEATLPAARRKVTETLYAVGDFCFPKPLSPAVIARRINQLADLTRAQQSSHETNQIQQEISQRLRSLGIAPQHKGFDYLKEAVLMVLWEPRLSRSLTKELYPLVASRFEGATAWQVERTIRYSVEIAWEQGLPRVQREYFGYSHISGRKKPTSGEFISSVVEKIRMKLGSGR